MKTLLFEVRIKVKGSPGIKEVSTYIKEALTNWGGGLDSEDTMFSSNISHTNISYVGVVSKNFILEREKLAGHRK